MKRGDDERDAEDQQHRAAGGAEQLGRRVAAFGEQPAQHEADAGEHEQPGE